MNLAAPRVDGPGTEDYEPAQYVMAAGRLLTVTLQGDRGCKTLPRRGFVLEYATLSWNVAGIVVLDVAAMAADLAAGCALVCCAAWEVREIFVSGYLSA
jgi:hypothetical protein